MSIPFEIALGVVVVLAITAATGWFVAQEFAYTTVDRARLRALAKDGRADAARALEITGRTSFMLSGAQLGITVTGLLVGYVAEPLIGEGLGEALTGSALPDGAGLVIGTSIALLFATVVQMIFGELFPKNLAISRPEASALRLARSTKRYLQLTGWLVAVFDKASEALLRLLRIEPVHDLEHSATPRDLEAIIDESRETGTLDDELSVLLDRVLDFAGRTAREAMVPRPRVVVVDVGTPLAELPALMASGHSRLPVLDDDGAVIGLVCLRDLLEQDGAALDARTVGEIARPPLLVPDSARLQVVLDALRAAGEELACVLDEHGALAGVVTIEDVAEELVGEITDEHDPAEVQVVVGTDQWQVPGDMNLDEAERLVDVPLPRGAWSTLGGLVAAHLQRLPVPGDVVELAVAPNQDEDPGPEVCLQVQVLTVERHVAASVQLRLAATEEVSA